MNVLVSLHLSWQRKPWLLPSAQQYRGWHTARIPSDDLFGTYGHQQPDLTTLMLILRSWLIEVNSQELFVARAVVSDDYSIRFCQLLDLSGYHLSVISPQAHELSETILVTGIPQAHDPVD